MHIFFGGDHTAHEVEEELKSYITSLGHKVISHSTAVYDPQDDYPDIAEKVALSVSQEKDSMGILVCGSGGGISLAANKIPGARAILAYTVEEATYARHDDNANILAMGVRFTSVDIMKKMIHSFLSTPFELGGRHERRFHKVEALEKKYFK